MSKLVRVGLVVLGLPFVTGCALSEAGDRAMSSSGSEMIGDENGGKIPRGVGGASAQSSAFGLVSQHCAKFGKKGFITKMDFDTGVMTFECRLQKTKTGTGAA